MGCYAPQQGWRSKALTSNGKRRIVFNFNDAFADRPIQVPCGICVGCRTDRAKEWAVRCSHEAQMHEHNAFVTLTYDDAKIPHVNDDPDGPFTLRKADFVNFMKRLRKARNHKVRFLQAAEYGQLGRPHHHALLFGVAFPDKKRWKRSGDNWLYRSAELEKLWDYGYSSIGDVTVESAMYVAQYTLKKQFSDKKHYGQIVQEYATMSRNHGIGWGWLQKYGGDIYPEDKVVTSSGYIMKPPRYYDQQLALTHPEGLAKIKALRLAQRNDAESSSGRLYAKQECHKARIRAGKERQL